MSLYRNYRNARIEFADHTDLIENDQKFRRTCRVLDEYMDNLRKRFKEGLIERDATVFIRVAPSSAITLYIGISKENNPYIFLYDALNSIVSKDIPYNEFSKIGEAPYVYMLEDYIKASNIERFKTFESDVIREQITKLVDEYDKTIQDRENHIRKIDRDELSR